MSKIRLSLAFLLVGIATLSHPVAAAAQVPEEGSGYRLYVVPQIGMGTDLEGVSDDNPLADVWTLGAQLELVNGSLWTPLLSYQSWHIDRLCGQAPACATRGWSVEGGLMHSFHPRSILRPYGGVVLGYQRLSDDGTYLQGRAGIDFTPLASPVTFRIEARY